MTMTASKSTKSDKKRGKKNSTSQEPNLFEKQEGLESAAEFLREHCYVVELEISWFATKRTLSKAESQSLIRASAEEADVDMLGVSMKLLDPKDEYIQKISKAKAALMAYRDSKTIPAAQIPMTSVIKDHQNPETARERISDVLQKRPGERIIMSADVDEFDHYVNQVLIPNLQAAVDEANRNIDKIRESAKTRLKSRFDPHSFPEEFKVGVRGPSYHSIGVSVSFEESCPQAAARMKEAARKQLEDTVSLATADFANTFMETVETVAEQLSQRTELLPLKDNDLYYLRNGVLRGMQFHKDNPDIPEGQRIITVEYKSGNKKITEDIGPISDAAFRELNPTESDKSGKIYESSMERLLDELSRFEQVRQMLGDIGAPMEGIVNKVRETLSRIGNNPKRITREIRESTFTRENAANLLATVADEVEAIVDSMPIAKKRRRRAISVGGRKK